MSLNLVTARARTRGKSPQEFTFQAIGRLSARKVNDKDGNPILVDADGKQLKYDLVKKGDKDVLPFENDSNGEPVAPEGTRFIEVDDVLTNEVTDNLQEVIDLAGAMSEAERGYVQVVDAEGNASKSGRSAIQFVINAALDGINYANRAFAAPVTEQVSKSELSPVKDALIAAKILSETDATTWQRSMTGTAKLMDMEVMAFAKTSPQYKKLLASGWKPTEVSA